MNIEQARQQAQDENTAPEILTQLAKSEDSQIPELPTLWVVTPGGLDLSRFPFGEAIRLLMA